MQSEQLGSIDTEAEGVQWTCSLNSEHGRKQKWSHLGCITRQKFIAFLVHSTFKVRLQTVNNSGGG